MPTRVFSSSVLAGTVLASMLTAGAVRGESSVVVRLELWSAPADGSAAPVKLNPPFGSGSQAKLFAITTNARVIFLADATAGRTELWAVPLAGPAAAAIRLNAPLGTSRNVTSFALVLDDRRVISTRQDWIVQPDC